MHVRAMENWGCINVADNVLLQDPLDQSTSMDTLHRAARTICHEISHMWFGNDVTMKWWTDIWLNEGFARYIEHIAVDNIKPQYHIWDKFYEQVYQEALQADADEHTHSVEVQCVRAIEIMDIFDTISYAKGASVIKMLSDYLSEDEFRKAICIYLKSYNRRNTETRDLWDIFDKVTGKNISKMMGDWTKRPGFPMVEVHICEGSNTALITQTRFCSDSSSGSGTDCWPIPIRYQDELGKKLILFEKEKETIAFSGFLKINIGHHGFYRTKYEPYALQLILKNIAKLSDVDRYGLLNDVTLLR